MGMTLTKEFVNNCRNVGVLRDFLCQAIDQVDEKDKEIAELKEQYKDMDVTHTVHIAKMNAKIEELEDNVDFWKKKLDDEMASRRDEYEKSEKEIRRLKRALYKACANWAKAMDFYEDNPNELWSKMKYKCRAKAEEYK